MRSVAAAIVLFASVAFSTPTEAAPPDPQFTQQMYEEIEARKDEALARIVATGFYPSEQQSQRAWCDALMWWKMSHPGGEAQLTMLGLIHLRQLEVMCGQRFRRAPVLATEPQTPPPTTVRPPTDGGPISDGRHEAVEDYMRWHPEEFADAPTLRQYILARLLWWNVFGEGRSLGPAAYDEGEAAELAKAEADWRAAHPGATDPPYDPRNRPGAGQDGADSYRGTDPRVWSGRGGPGSRPLDLEETPAWMRQSILEWENRTADGSVDPTAPQNDRSAEGSVDPLDQRWIQVRQPIVVGSNDDVGSGARRRAQAIGAATGVVGSVLGVGGGRREPELARCRVNEHTQARFENGDVAIDVVAQRSGETVTIFTEIARSPDSGTFQSVFLQNQNGQMLAPSDVDICALYGQWRLSVSWTRTTYQDGRQTGQDSGGWTEAGRLGIPGLENPDGAPDGLWKRLGFSNASHGARRVALTFALPADQLMRDGAALVVHVTRPGQDPVTTVPFSLMLEETAAGILIARCP